MVKTFLTSLGAAILAYGMITAQAPEPLSKAQPRVQLASR